MSECVKNKMAAALFGGIPEMAGREHSLRGQDPGSAAGHPVMDKEEAQGKNIQRPVGSHEWPSWLVRAQKEND